MKGNRPAVHTEPLFSYTDDGIEDAYRRGRAWVQRNLREWPYDHSLYYRIRTEGKEDFLDFYFVPSDEGDNDPFLF